LAYHAGVEALIPIFAIFAVFGFPVIAVLGARVLKYRHEERLRELQGQAEQRKALPAADEMEARVRNLESIVCSVDFELNTKLDRLARHQLVAARAETPAGQSPASSETILVLDGELRPGERIADRFVVESLLGRGGMGAVYVCRDERLGESVVLKVVAGLSTISPDAHDRLRREGAIARRITHPNVVRLHDIGEHEGLVFLSMEHVQGEGLDVLVRRQGVLPSSRVAAISRQLCDGLGAAHEVGAVHRDLKPANILIDTEGRVKIIDFGLARLAQLEGMTATNLIAGTPAFMAPEQIRGGTIDARTDVYAMGAVMHYMLTGKAPFEADNPIALAMLHCNRDPSPPSTSRDELDPRWDAVVLRALAKRPDDRFPSAAALRHALPDAPAPAALERV
jgi:eukaryotic-like serine/threonine-protein kinase